MRGAPPTKHEILDQIDVIVKAVDQRGREIEERWGIGRLPTLVPIDVAERFRIQLRKFSGAVWEYDHAEVRKHGDAMLRAYAKLEELAVEAGAKRAPPEQWEIETPEGLIVIVRDVRDTGGADLGGRAGQVWSLDEVASVIRAHPTIVTAKEIFPGAVVESVRPAADLKQELNDSLMDLPFA